MNSSNIKMLGIIGGMGPLADTAFLKALHLATAATRDCEYVPIIYDGNCIRPDRSSFITQKDCSSPFISLKKSLRSLEKRGADVIVIPCNTAHFWFKKLESSASRNTVLLNMPSTACDCCAKKGLRRVGLLATEGTYKSRIYSSRLKDMGIECIEPSSASKELLSEVIRKIKGGEKAVFDRIENELLSQNCEAVITGCSELSYILLNSQNERGTVYIDPISVLAVSAVSACGRPTRHIPYC